ncbi:hypothetical protein [Cellulomonas rhizosphaerae]|uniref:ATP/GTP-binding protein n=1 Tax=Cellulomonas rhizosphaerae TaxID=2293719 RepID=A0A413RKN0_9CELL|nr:hypothetical protein [Cellulomonas rhizosphaerae]RHA39805.1 hypothetical protein D1825_11240 [Cellulomonas rhizosphaerae]
MLTVVRRLVVALAVAALCVTAPATGASADPECHVNPLTGTCVIEVTDPGDPGDPDDPGDPGGGGGGGPRVCEDWDGPIDCESELGTWDNDRSCYLEVADPQPPKSDPAWEGNSDGEIYRCMIPNPASPGSWWTTYVWLGEPPEAGPDPAVLAQQAVAQMTLRAGEIGMNPSGEPEAISIVGVPTWLWVADPDEHTVGPITRSVTAGGTTVTATGTLDEIVWDMGEGHEVTCDGPGTPWSEGRSDDEATCSYSYARSSARQPDLEYTVTATSSWTIAWEGGGENGTIPLSFTRSAQVQVGEIQAITIG